MPQKDLKNAGLKVTLPRLKVLEVLEAEGPHHLSAEDVYRKLIASDESVGLATVYRVLTQFETAGIVDRHNFDDGHAVYELAHETHHDHMVDIDTGTVTEFVSSHIEELQKDLAREYGFELVDHELVLYVRKRTENCQPNQRLSDLAQGGSPRFQHDSRMRIICDWGTIDECRRSNSLPWVKPQPLSGSAMRVRM